MRQALGILGGLGPLASADFVLSIYERNMGQTEQEAPAIVLYSDPGFPDRTEVFLQGNEHLLVGPLETALERLSACDVTRVAIACVTIHHLFSRLPKQLREKIISLVDIILDAVVANQQPALLLSTTGTRRMQIFEQNEHWAEAAPFIVFPDDEDQEKLHQYIYKHIKASASCDPLISFLDGLCRKYEVQQLIAGCTELHRLSREISNRRSQLPAHVIDPLMILACDYKDYLKEGTQPFGRLCRSRHAVVKGEQPVANSFTAA
jgi:aspartate racemase